MKKLYFLFVLMIFVFTNSFAQDFKSVYSLYLNHDYYKFKNAILSSKSLNKVELNINNALKNSVFCNFNESNLLINNLLKENSNDIHDSIKAELYSAKVINHINLFEYKEASKSSKILKEKYYQYLDSTERIELSDEEGLWKAVETMLPQTVSKKGDVKIQIKKDIAGLWNIPVNIAKQDFDFIFDTGANFSVIVESLALKLGMKLIDANLKVGTASDIKVDSKVAVCDELLVDKIVYRNVVFLVLPDASLDFGIYKIKGILGNPVIKAFEEFRINKDNELYIPEIPSKSTQGNLSFYGFTPVILMYKDNDSVNFTFDTGAGQTMFYKPYLEKYSKEIIGNYEMVDINVGGAGGTKTVKGYRIKDIKLRTGQSETTLSKVSLLSENLKEKDNYFFGNLGQDYISQFNEMTINFKDMFIQFK